MDFKKILAKLTGADKQALELLIANADFTAEVKIASDNMIGAAVDSAKSELTTKVNEFRENNKILEQKLNDVGGIDPAEYKRLKALGSKAGEANEVITKMEQDHATEMSALNEIIGEYKTREETAKEESRVNSFTQDFTDAINAHNTANPTMKIAPSAHRAMISDALNSHSTVNDKLVFKSTDGKEFLNGDGFGSAQDWIGSVYIKENPHVVDRASGTGTDGNNASLSGGEKTAAEKISDGLNAG